MIIRNYKSRKVKIIMTKSENLKSYSLEEAKYYKVHGRTETGMNPLPLFFNGSGIEVNVTGSELWIDLEVDCDFHEPWIWTALNGEFMSRQMLLPGTYSICLFRGMSPEAVKNVKLMREIQAMTEDDACHILIKGFQTDGFFLPTSDRRFKLEFIGDSITSGEGTYGATEDSDWLTMYMSTSRNYAVLTSDALDADYHLFSQGGWGVYCGWDNDVRHNIPSRYEKLCGLCGGEFNEKLGAGKPYQFDEWKPDAIIVNLGTNDASAFNQPPFTDPETGKSFQQRRNPDDTYNQEDLMRFEQAVIDFLLMLRKNNPYSHIVWTYGMLGYDLTLSITDAINTYRKQSGDTNVAFLQLPNTTAETVGSHAHPGLKSHQRAAGVLIEYLRGILETSY